MLCGFGIKYEGRNNEVNKGPHKFMKIWRTTSSISLFRDNSPQLMYFADRNGLLLSENILLFYLLLIPPAPPPVVFQHRTLPSLSNFCEKGWTWVQAICESVLNKVVRIPNY